jgi:uncharacterized protein with ACT and thioredoxin-like domain
MNEQFLFNRRAEERRLAQTRRAMAVARKRRRELLSAAGDLRRQGKAAEADQMLRRVAEISVVPAGGAG